MAAGVYVDSAQFSLWCAGSALLFWIYVQPSPIDDRDARPAPAGQGQTCDVASLFGSPGPGIRSMIVTSMQPKLFSRRDIAVLQKESTSCVAEDVTVSPIPCLKLPSASGRSQVGRIGENHRDPTLTGTVVIVLQGR